MTKYSKAEIEKAYANLREWIKPGDTPNPNKPDREWFGAAGYALKHRWL